MSKLNLSLIVESENETKDILMDMLMNYDNLHIYKVKKQENIINTETKEIKKGSYKIDFIFEKESKNAEITLEGRPKNLLKTNTIESEN
jgi:hypothetical protein|nr:MAG TPA: hypothetical protein [Caudoviricetes sp.]